MLLFFILYFTCMSSLVISKRNFPLSMKSGGHGDGFRYLPVHQAKPSENFPRIVQIAGIYPSINPEDIFAPPPSLPVKKGTWMYDFSDPNGPHLGTIALPPSDVVTNAVDPVALISTCAAIGLKVIDDLETVVVIDRGDRVFNQEKFYAFRTPENKVVVQWSDRLEPGYEILGRVILCTVPWSEGMRTPKTGFVEDDEEDE